MEHRPMLSVLELLDLFAALGAVLLTAVSALLTGLPGRGPDDEPSLYLHVCYAATRKLLARCSAEQLQWLLPRASVVYRQQTKAFGLTPRVIDLPHGARGNWIGDPDADHVLVWYHGGGFGLPVLHGHMKFLMRFIKSRGSRKPSLSILFLEYTLAPRAQYPTQLIQAVETLRYLITTTKRSPSNIMIGGDSAGGNLVTAVLSHLKHGHEAIDKLTLSEPLAAAIMMAPWTGLNKPDVLLERYSGGDVVSKASLHRWAANYTGDATPDYYTDASRASAEWFHGFPVNKILVLAGQHEYLLPAIDGFVKTLQAGYGPVEFYVAEKEAHDAPFVNLFCHDYSPTRQGTKLMDWIEGVVA
ncbi:hypothetical protein E4U13_006840 [Claviceps humidiphila]|uniref:Alpha/beta hydrolase fold-3 domain-containing protein n=1 Tax=Claviceps humidiphila TaxID=1294629 RepID=A0A9P7Q503_9HYPO|nr:hypothetical protein E4U13_006840 [Claviceps humidiphila]